ncbi:glycine cleavage system aminomethyltransferase GcvT [Tessaracoccus defluvii]|uniref:aminomethyltransferase n=1 Tax=Tessaracoccus defluvii TaxID=1285901 RepID=A0A7H0H8Y3_9ACTN|nr:glycine cleavage system aminomethyltransferase GcvT [Tessaracoccus defluvii]QNP56999.1 glycine cleavage system aminomethyltransferase GcvT [Tessaracoccus defluvii]
MSLRTTALHALHTELGGRLVDFAGWELPVQFAGGIAEHQHTRTAASLFDVSHMGQVLVRPLSGDLADAAAALESVIPASVAGLAEGRQRYGLLTTQAGGVVDDLMFAHRGDAFLVVLNAARTEVDLGLLNALDGVAVELLTDRALLALQGPAAAAALGRLVPGVTECTFMDAVSLDWDGTALWVSRSGYTGEDGFEVSLPADRAAEFARLLLAEPEVAPAGLGARDSLRLEAGMPLYGHELSEDVTPVEAGLGWAIPKVRRPGGSRADGYPGAAVISTQLADGAPRERIGLLIDGRAPVREGAALFADATATDPIGVVTSGGFSPTLGHPIAMALVAAGSAPDGATTYAELRGKRVPATVAPMPFVPHAYHR